ncbi:sterol desaturase family protein [Spirosoma sp. KNUC1025]|uniref:sterol desaturase family protein n=1 Tax=Spirosoma sp. KNUC1025 TaxID=2894082 RepID=UPI003869D1E5
MALETSFTTKITRDALISVFLYSLPILTLLLWCQITGETPWKNQPPSDLKTAIPAAFQFVEPVFRNFKTWGLPVLILVLGIAEFALGLYDNKWTKNEKTLDLVCFFAPKLLVPPTIAFFSLQILPYLLPDFKNIFGWVPFWSGLFIIAVADDLTQYWYHRLHHQVPFMWRFHRTHHSAPYMGMAMASRQNFIYTIFSRRPI